MNKVYTVLGIKELSTGDRIIKLRNPKGKEQYKGDWSDGSSKWTDALRKEAGAVQGDDGYFWMSVEDYQSQGKETHFTADTDSMHQSYFLRLGDDGTGSTPGQYSWCGS